RVGGVVGITEIAQPVEVARHALDQRVVVGAGLHVVALAARSADDGFGEELKGARVAVGAVQDNLPVRPGGIHIAPGLDLAARLPDRLELRDAQRRDEVVAGVDDQRDTVVADQKASPVDPLGLGLGLFLGLGGPRGVDNVYFALQVAAETAAGP